MIDKKTYGLEQARAQLPLIASEAEAGYSSEITRHGKPIAKVVPLEPAPWKPVWTTLPELKVGGSPEDHMAPLYPDGFPRSEHDPL